MSLAIDAHVDPPRVGAFTMPRVGAFSMALMLICAGMWVYRNSLDGEGVFDDTPGVAMALSLYKEQGHRIWIPRPRTLAYLTIALNHRIGGLKVRGYHQFNRVVHLLAALALFGVARRSLSLPSTLGRQAARADWIALCIAMLWLLHPLQTQSVTYMVQRIESLMAMFYLLCFYCFIRGATTARGWPWYLAAVIVFWFGIGTKEVIATAPPLMIVYDRVYLSGSWREVFRRRWWFYGLMLAPLIVFAVYMLPYFLGSRPHTMGLSHPWITPLMYARTQSAVILHYLRLTIWPDKLCLDYCWPVMPWRALVVPLIVLGLMLLTTLWAIWRHPRIGFLAFAFFAILAPTSSFVPINDLAMEHRMYLPLACLAALFVLAVEAVCSWIASRLGRPRESSLALACGVVALVSVPLAMRTITRNAEYRTALSLWQSATEARPESHRAQFNLGVSLVQAGRKRDSLIPFRRAFEAACLHWGSRNDIHWYWADLRQAIVQYGEPGDLMRILDEDARGYPEVSHFHWFLALELFQKRDYSLTSDELRKVLVIDPAYAEASASLATVELVTGKPHEALAHMKQAVHCAPDDIEMQNFLAWVLATHPDPFIRDGREALRISEDICYSRKSESGRSFGTLAGAYAETGQFERAIDAARKSIELCQRPDDTGKVENARDQLACYLKGQPYRMKLEDLAKTLDDLSSRKSNATDAGTRRPTSG